MNLKYSGCPLNICQWNVYDAMYKAMQFFKKDTLDCDLISEFLVCV